MPLSDAIILQALGCNITFGRLITDQREKSGDARPEFAQRLGISANRLASIEAAKVRVLPSEAAGFANTLKESEEQFIRLAIQEMLDSAGLEYNVVLEAKKM